MRARDRSRRHPQPHARASGTSARCPIRAYALCILAGIVAAVWLDRAALGGPRRPPGDVLDIAVWAVPFGIVGGRLYHVITTPAAVLRRGRPPAARPSPSGRAASASGAPSRSAASAPGSPAGARGIPLPRLRRRRWRPGSLVAQAIGRLGNWFNNELYGGPTDLPWGLKIYEWDGGRAAVGADGQPVVLGYFHPTFLYELLWNLAAAALRRSGPTAGSGSATAGPSRSTSLSYCVGRLWIELLRIDPAEHFFGVRLNVFTAIIVGPRRAGLLRLACAAGPGREVESTAGPRGGRRAIRMPRARVRMITGPPTPADAFPQARTGQEPT